MSAWKGWTGAAVLVVGVFIVLGLIADAFAPAPAGPTGSSYATSPGGVAAWAELLTRAGHPVQQLRSSLAGTDLPSAATLVVLGVPSLTPAEGHNLDRFVAGGGRLVIGGGDPTLALPELLSAPPRWSAAGAAVFRPAAPAPEVRGVGTVRSAGEGTWMAGQSPGAPEQVALAATNGRSLLDVLQFGRGRIALLADPSPLENRLLGSADDAELALDLAGEGGRPVIFAESIHGFGEASGLAAIPTRWWLTFAGLALAGAAWVLSRGRRIGPPEAPGETGPPPRTAYVDALAAALARDPDGVLALEQRLRSGT